MEGEGGGGPKRPTQSQHQRRNPGAPSVPWSTYPANKQEPRPTSSRYGTDATGIKGSSRDGTTRPRAGFELGKIDIPCSGNAR